MSELKTADNLYTIGAGNPANGIVFYNGTTFSTWGSNTTDSRKKETPMFDVNNDMKAVVEELDAFRAHRDVAARRRQRLLDEAFQLESIAALKRKLAERVLDEVEEPIYLDEHDSGEED